MQWIVNRLRGELRVVARGPFPERLMNVCAQNGISFWALEWRDGHTLSMTVRQEDRKQLWKLAERVGCTVETEGSRGLPAFLARFRTRMPSWRGSHCPWQRCASCPASCSPSR